MENTPEKTLPAEIDKRISELKKWLKSLVLDILRKSETRKPRKIDIAGLGPLPGDPQDATEGLERLSQIAVSPSHTILIGIIFNLLFAFAVFLVLFFFSRLNPFTALSLLALQGLYFRHCIIQVPLAHFGVPLFFGMRNRPWTKIYAEGWVWRLRPLCGVDIKDTQRKRLDLHDDCNEHQFEVNAASAKNRGEVGGDYPEEGKKEKDLETEIVPMLVNAYAIYQIWNPWRSTSAGETDAILGMNSHVIGKVRDASVAYTESEMRADKDALENVAKTAANDEAGQWGMWVPELSIQSITPKSLKVVAAHESVVIARRGRKASRHIEQGARVFQEMGMSAEAAVLAHDDQHGRAHVRRQIVFSGANSDPLGLMRAATMIGERGSENGNTEETDDRARE